MVSRTKSCIIVLLISKASSEPNNHFECVVVLASSRSWWHEPEFIFRFRSGWVSEDHTIFVYFELLSLGIYYVYYDGTLSVRRACRHRLGGNDPSIVVFI